MYVQIYLSERSYLPKHQKNNQRIQIVYDQLAQTFVYVSCTQIDYKSKWKYLWMTDYLAYKYCFDQIHTNWNKYAIDKRKIRGDGMHQLLAEKWIVYKLNDCSRRVDNSKLSNVFQWVSDDVPSYSYTSFAVEMGFLAEFTIFAKNNSLFFFLNVAGFFVAQIIEKSEYY